MIKVIGTGFYFAEGAYLRDGWNWLDFVVVATSLMSLAPGLPNVSALRAFRVMRPLRALTSVPGMRQLVQVRGSDTACELE